MTINTIQIGIKIVIVIILFGVIFGDIKPTPETNIVPISTPEPSGTPIPTFITPTPESTITKISGLERYDRDKNGVIDNFEIKVIETDYHYKRLTKNEVAVFIAILGYTPVINPLPIPTPKSTSLPYKSSQTSSIIPNNYYEDGQSFPDGLDIYEYLSNSEWLIEYEADVFDCSQMAGYMEWYLIPI